MKKSIKTLVAVGTALFIAALALTVLPLPEAKAAASGSTINLRQLNLLNGNYAIAQSSTNNIVSGATNTIIFSGSPTNNETITIYTPGPNGQSTTYTFEPLYTNFAGMVLIDASGLNAASKTVTNLVNAINGGSGSGTTYGAMTATNPLVTASVLNSTSLVVTVIIPGATVGNNTFVSIGSTNVYPLLSQQCTGGFLAQGDIIPVNGCGVSISYKCPTNTVGVGTNFARIAFHIRGSKIPTNGTVFTVACPYGSNPSTEQTVTTNVPTSICGNMRFATLIGLDSTSTNSPTFTDFSVNTEPTQ